MAAGGLAGAARYLPRDRISGYFLRVSTKCSSAYIQPHHIIDRGPWPALSWTAVKELIDNYFL